MQAGAPATTVREETHHSSPARGCPSHGTAARLSSGLPAGRAPHPHQPSTAIFCSRQSPGPERPAGLRETGVCGAAREPCPAARRLHESSWGQQGPRDRVAPSATLPVPVPVPARGNGGASPVTKATAPHEPPNHPISGFLPAPAPPGRVRLASSLLIGSPPSRWDGIGGWRAARPPVQAAGVGSERRVRAQAGSPPGTQGSL